MRLKKLTPLPVPSTDRVPNHLGRRRFLDPRGKLGSGFIRERAYVGLYPLLDRTARVGPADMMVPPLVG